jgi:hypothetical protein
MFDVAERILSRYGMSEYYGSEGFDDGLGCEWIMCLCVCVCWSGLDNTPGYEKYLV